MLLLPSKSKEKGFRLLVLKAQGQFYSRLNEKLQGKQAVKYQYSIEEESGREKEELLNCQGGPAHGGQSAT